MNGRRSKLGHSALFACTPRLLADLGLSRCDGRNVRRLGQLRRIGLLVLDLATSPVLRLASHVQWPDCADSIAMSEPVYGQLLGEVPHNRRVQEGVLLAARGTGDCTQLSQVCQQVRAYLDGETDIDLHSNV